MVYIKFATLINAIIPNTSLIPKDDKKSSLADELTKPFSYGSIRRKRDSMGFLSEGDKKIMGMFFFYTFCRLNFNN